MAARRKNLGAVNSRRASSWRPILLLTCAVLFLAQNRRLALDSANLERILGGGAFASNSTTSKVITTDVVEDGCGLVDDRNSSTWTKLPGYIKEEEADIQQCLRRHGHGKMVTPIGDVGLNCSTEVGMETVRSTLSRYGTVWLHGDSVMEQALYTLACMMNSSVSLPMEIELGGPGKMRWKTGLGYDGIEKFTYRHPKGSTKFIYSRFGAMWGLDANLYKHDFPLAVKTLTSRDAIFINLSAHIWAAAGSGMERAMDFVAEQSLVANATVFYLEPHPEEWPTSNGMYTEGCIFRCSCEHLTDARLSGRGEFTQDFAAAPSLAFGGTSTGTPCAISRARATSGTTRVNFDLDVMGVFLGRCQHGTERILALLRRIRGSGDHAAAPRRLLIAERGAVAILAALFFVVWKGVVSAA